MTLSPLRIAVATAMLTASTASSQTEYSAVGTDAAGIQPTVDAFRAGLGVLNPNDPTSLASGRREVSWDAVPDEDAAPALLSGAYFNQPDAGRAAGLLLATPYPGAGFQVSADAANPSATPVEFGDVDATYPTAFGPFSAERLATPLQNNVVDVEFRFPGADTAAAVRGFGAVFTDVDQANSASIEYFRQGASLGVFDVPAMAGDATLSFLGVDFGENVVTGVRITVGEAALGDLDVTQQPGNADLVVLDDLVFGEPGDVFVDLEGVCARLEAFADEIDSLGASKKLEKQLGKRVDKAKKKVELAEKKAGKGKGKKSGKLLQSAVKQLWQLEKTLTKQDAVEELPMQARKDLATEAAEIGAELATLRDAEE